MPSLKDCGRQVGFQKKAPARREAWQVIYGGLGFFVGGELSGLLGKLLFVGVEVVSEFALELGDAQ